MELRLYDKVRYERTKEKGTICELEADRGALIEWEDEDIYDTTWIPVRCLEKVEASDGTL